MVIAQFQNIRIYRDGDDLNMRPHWIKWHKFNDPDIVLPSDANHDGLVTGAKLIAIQQNFGAIGSAMAISEPASVLWRIGLGIGIGCRGVPWRRTAK